MASAIKRPCSCSIIQTTCLYTKQAVNGEECNILDVDEALRSGSDLGLAASFEVGRLPEAHIESLKAPLWLHEPQVLLSRCWNECKCKADRMTDLCVHSHTRTKENRSSSDCCCVGVL